MGYPLRDITGPQWRAIREARGITMREAASAVGIARTTLRGIERGTQHPGVLVRRLLAHHYGVAGR